MDGDEKTKEQQDKSNNDHYTNDWNFFQSTWLRRVIPGNNELHRFLLDYRCYFLWPVGILLWIILFTTQNIY